MFPLLKCLNTNLNIKKNSTLINIPSSEIKFYPFFTKILKIYNDYNITSNHKALRHLELIKFRLKTEMILKYEKCGI